MPGKKLSKMQHETTPFFHDAASLFTIHGTAPAVRVQLFLSWQLQPNETSAATAVASHRNDMK